METREMTCIGCPMGCRLSVKREGDEITVTCNTCPRGDKYARQEFTNPMRTVTSSVFVRGGKMPLCSVKTRDTISKASIPEALVRPLGMVIISLESTMAMLGSSS